MNNSPSGTLPGNTSPQPIASVTTVRTIAPTLTLILPFTRGYGIATLLLKNRAPGLCQKIVKVSGPPVPGVFVTGCQFAGQRLSVDSIP